MSALQKNTRTYHDQYQAVESKDSAFLRESWICHVEMLYTTPLYYDFFGLFKCLFLFAVMHTIGEIDYKPSAIQMISRIQVSKGRETIWTKQINAPKAGITGTQGVLNGR